MSATWRVLEYGSELAAANMAVDEVLYDGVRAGESPVLRLYTWNAPAVTIGRFQSIPRTISVNAAIQHNLPLIRRITGGRGILHGDDLTLSVVCKTSHVGLQAGFIPPIKQLYSIITEVLSEAITAAGVVAAPGQSVDARRDAASATGDCFAMVASSDLVSSGTKVLGGAMHVADDNILFQASIPLWNPAHVQDQQRVAADVFLGAHVAPYTVAPLDTSNLTRAITQCWTLKFGGNAPEGNCHLSNGERSSVNQMVDLRYGRDEWTNGSLRSLNTTELN